MDEEAFNISVRQFLKKLGITAQREIELAVRDQVESGQLTGDEALPTEARITIGGIHKEVVVTGEITLSER